MVREFVGSLVVSKSGREKVWSGLENWKYKFQIKIPGSEIGARGLHEENDFRRQKIETHMALPPGDTET